MLKKRILILSILGIILPCLLIACKKPDTQNQNESSPSQMNNVQLNDKVKKIDNKLNFFMMISITTHFVSLAGIGFIFISKSKEIQKINETCKTEFEGLKTGLKQSKNEIKELQYTIEKIKDKIKRRDEKILTLQSRLDNLNQQKINIATPPSNTYYQQKGESLRPSLRNSFTNKSLHQQVNNNRSPRPENIPLNQQYNQNQPNLLSSGIVVTLTEVSANKIFRQMWSGNVEFEKNKQGEYFIIEGKNGECYLFPCGNKNIDLRTIKNANIFRIIGEDEGIAKGENIQVNNPAKVEKNGQYWRLLEEGEIKVN